MAHDRKRKSERAALTGRTFGFDASPMDLYHVTGNRQPQPTAPAFLNSWYRIIGLRPCAIDFIEAFKDARQVFEWNASAGIAHKKILRRPLAAHMGTSADDHRAAGRGKLDGVVQQVDQYARDLLAIGGYQRLPLLDLRAQVDAVALRLGQHTRHDFAH